MRRPPGRAAIALLLASLLLVSGGVRYAAGARATADTFGVVASVPLGPPSEGQWENGPLVDPITGDLILNTGTAFASPGYRAPVVAISGTTNQVVWVGHAGPDPIAGVDAGTGNVYLANFDQGDWTQANVTVLSGSTGLPLANISTPEEPWSPVYDPDNGNMYVGDGAGVSVISGVTNRIVANITPESAPNPTLFDPLNGELYGLSSPSGGESVTVAAESPVTDRIVSNLTLDGNPLGFGNPVLDPVNGDLYVPDLTGITVISTVSNTVVGNLSLVPLIAWGSSLSIAPNGDLYILSPGVPETVSIVSGQTNQVISSFPVGQPWWTTYDPVDGVLYAEDARNDSLTVFNATTYATISTVSLPTLGGPQLVPPVWDPENDQLYLTYENGQLVVVSPHAPTETVGTSPYPWWAYAGSGFTVGLLVGAVNVVFLVRRSKRKEDTKREPVASSSNAAPHESPPA